MRIGYMIDIHHRARGRDAIADSMDAMVIEEGLLAERAGFTPWSCRTGTAYRCRYPGPEQLLAMLARETDASPSERSRSSGR